MQTPTNGKVPAGQPSDTVAGIESLSVAGFSHHPHEKRDSVLPSRRSRSVDHSTDYGTIRTKRSLSLPV
jgi:hypothetical protein